MAATGFIKAIGMALKIEENVSLKTYSTMRVGGVAKYLARVSLKNDLVEAAEFAKDKGLSIFILGRGANVMFKDSGFDGLVIVNDIRGFEVIEENDEGATIKIGAGEDWDKTVLKTVEMGLSGMEALSLIPGTVGAAPVMNIGAYGQEVAEIIESVTAYDLRENKFAVLGKENGGFQYRASRFSGEDKGRFIIADVTFKFHRNRMKPPFYRDVEKYFEDNGVTDYSPQAVRDAVIYIRTNKLPDPNKIATNGSFFKNPVIGKEKWEELVKKFPELDTAEPQWPQKPRWFLDNGTVKIAAARLIELAGLEGYEEGGVSLWPTQHLTVVNKDAKSAGDVLAFKDKIKAGVKEKFGIDLEEEVQVVG